MKILHVTLGNPDTHQGGLNRYCSELAEYQRKNGNYVDIIYPGSFKGSKNPKIRKRRYNKYEIFDGLPVAITYGIDDPDRYMVSINNNVYEEWLLKQNYDVIHVHSIQGIHLEFFNSAKKIGIPIIFTTHDYYPICFRCVLVDHNQKLCNESTNLKCTECINGSGLSEKKQKIMQSNFYQIIKNIKLIKGLKRTVSKQEEIAIDKDISKELISKVNRLKNYYRAIMSNISLLHCNSSLTYDEYDKYFPDIKKIIVSIAHGGLYRSRHQRLKGSHLNVSYMGGMSTHKGYLMMKKLMTELSDKYPNQFDFWMYGGEYTENNRNNCHFLGYFSNDEEKFVWERTDLLIVASQWKETFGFIVLEALCRGIPVICSDLVGSKDLLKNISESLIFKYDDYKELEIKVVRLLDNVIYEKVLEDIEKLNLEYDMHKHISSIDSLYKFVFAGEKND